MSSKENTPIPIMIQNDAGPKYLVRDAAGERGPYTMAELLALWDKHLLRTNSLVRATDANNDKWETFKQLIDQKAEAESVSQPAPEVSEADVLRKQILDILVSSGEIPAMKKYRELVGCDVAAAQRYVHQIRNAAKPETEAGQQIQKMVQKKAQFQNKFNIGCLSIILLVTGFWIYRLINPTPPEPLSAEEQIYGRRPTTGYNYVEGVEPYLKEHLKDPGSLEIIRFGTLQGVDNGNGQKGWLVRVQYRAKNSFGGYVVEEGVALVRDGHVINWVGVPH